MHSPTRRAVKLIEIVLVVLIFAGITAVLMPSLHRAKELAMQELSQAGRAPYGPTAYTPEADAARLNESGGMPRRTVAHVKTYKARIDLTPKLSVGTATPESIYEARFSAEIGATNPGAAKGECEISMPLPPQIISLSDLEVTVSGEPSENLFLRDGALVWQGQLDVSEPTAMTVSYTALGKGIYVLNTPPGKIVDVFEATLTAHQTDLNMLELSLQPEPPKRESGNTIYTWKYKRLMLGRPIALDIFGIAPMDRLGELSWLGPISVLVFGLLVALVVLAYRPEKLDRWTLLLIVGVFAGAYPLMYFAQEFTSLTTAVLGAALLVLAIIAVRAVTLLGPRLGVPGVIVLAGAIFTLTLWATVVPETQGILLTVIGISTFALAMVLLPKAQRWFRSAAAAPAAAPSAPPGRPEQPE